MEITQPCLELIKSETNNKVMITNKNLTDKALRSNMPEEHNINNTTIYLTKYLVINLKSYITIVLLHPDNFFTLSIGKIKIKP